jgi:PAS domain-containing protein
LLLTDRLGVIVYANVLAKDLLGGTLEFPTDKFWEAIQQRELTCAKERSSVCYPDFLNNVPYSVSLTALTDKTDYRGCLILLQPATSDDYHRMLANVPVGILSVDENNVVTFANTAANTLLQSLSVTKLSDMIHPSYHVLLANRLAALRDGQHLACWLANTTQPLASTTNTGNGVAFSEVCKGDSSMSTSRSRITT